MVEKIQRSFTSGEISPALRSRADLVKYSTGLALCSNMFVKPEGGVYSRVGTRFIGEVDDSSLRPRILPFSFNTTQTYILVFEDQKMQVIKDGGYVLTGGPPVRFELATPYLEADLYRLIVTQDADVLTIAHPDYGVRNLSRTDHDAWSLDLIDFTPSISAPTIHDTDNSVAVTNATQADPCVISTAGHTFVDGDRVQFDTIGGMTELNGNTYTVTDINGLDFEINVDSTGFTAYTAGGNAVRNGLKAVGAGAGSNNKEYAYVVTAVNADGVESLPSEVVAITTPSLATTAGVRFTWTPITGAEYYRIYKDPAQRSSVYGFIGESKVAEFYDYNVAPISSDAPPEDRDPFSASASDNPSTVAYYQQRQVFANTINDPQTVFTTQTGIYNSLRRSRPSRDDDAVTFTINSRQVNEIRHIVELDSMVILTSSAEYRITEGQDEVLTPATVGARKQSNNGASWVAPVVIDDTIVYVQEKGSRIRDINYEFADDKYKGNDLSIMARHLFEWYTIEEMDYSAEPYGQVYFIRDDGEMLVLTYQREHQVKGWSHYDSWQNEGGTVTKASFESVAVISEDGRDAVYVVVKRIINGATVRYIERFEQRYDDLPENVWHLDCALRYDDVPATVFTGFDHLEGQTVAAVADGNVVSNLVVTSGTVTLPRAASKVVIGLEYLPAIELLDMELNSTSESLKSDEKSVSSVTIEFERSRGAFVGPIKDREGEYGAMFEIKPRYDADNYDAIPLRTMKETVIIDPLWSKGGGLRIEQRSPMPMSILSVIPKIDSN